MSCLKDNANTNVLNKIDRSSQKEQRLMYSTSNLNFSGHDRLFLPLICANPVMPGRTWWRLFCSAENKVAYSTGRGRGPTNDISPRKTFQSCGSSSRLEARRRLPQKNFRCCSVLLVSEDSVRNFQSIKLRPFFPIRSCLKKIGNWPVII